MNRRFDSLSRRDFVAKAALVGGGVILGQKVAGNDSKKNPTDKALIAITLDLEMVRNFPKWEDTHWDYEKGNLQTEMKKYALEAARRVRAHGGVIHFFLVCRALEQENVDWLKELIQSGHSIGNHTYDHVYLLATKPEEIQYRFARAPWLIEGKTPTEVIRENIRLASAAMKTRLGISPAGFRTPGGFADGLANRPDVQKMLLDLGFTWVSAKYPVHPNSEPGKEPTAEVFDGIVKAQAAAQPFVYPTGLIDIPMNPISDIGAFRNGRWKLEHFLKAIRLGVEWAIEKRAVFDFLAHPACLSAMDPEFRTIELICEMVEKAGDRAALVNLDAIAARAKPR
jgi:peptidoglycan/xylan/chitin deacetylase (PgdA/CDA1 family)